jgi:hypothetical protein
MCLLALGIDYFIGTGLSDELGVCKGEGRTRKLATATQPQFPRIVISLSVS